MNGLKTPKIILDQSEPDFPLDEPSDLSCLESKRKWMKIAEILEIPRASQEFNVKGSQMELRADFSSPEPFTSKIMA